MDSEDKIEKTLHDQLQHMSQMHDTLTADMHRSHLKVVLAILAVGMAIVVAAVFKN